MSKVTANMSVSADGFFTGPNDSKEQPLGEGGEVLHKWIFSALPDDAVDTTGASPRTSAGNSDDANVLDELFTGNGAVVMGRRSFDFAEENWGPEPPFRTPVFVLTHAERQPITRGATSFNFVTDGIEGAIERARIAAGTKNVGLHGGTAIQQALHRGLLDELQLHLVPVLLASGKRLLENLGAQPVQLERTRVIESPEVTHLRFRVEK